MNNISKSVKIGVVQMTATHNIEQNFIFCKKQIESASKQEAKMIFFPECFYYFPSQGEEHLKMSKEWQNNEEVLRFKQLAIQHNIWLSLGGLQIKQQNEEKVENTHIIIDNLGEIVNRYVKVHLFNVNIDEINTIKESNFCSFGQEYPMVKESPLGPMGLSICYDLRFPELFRRQQKEGAQVFVNPAAFLQKTGQAHWHILQQARAIENGCFVIAAAQVGSPFQNRQLFGHSLVVDPWGKVILDMGDQFVGLACLDIDLQLITDVRQKLPQSNARTDLYL